MAGMVFEDGRDGIYGAYGSDVGAEGAYACGRCCLKPAAESLVILLAVGQFAVHQAYKVYHALEAYFVVRGAVDVLIEHISQAFLLEVEA